MGQPRIRSSLFAFLLSFALLSLSWPTTLADHHEPGNDIGFGYDPNSKIGPQFWGRLRPEWRLCSAGRMQSPIDISTRKIEVVRYLGDLRLHYRPSNAVLVNEGHLISVQWEGDAGYIEQDHIRYALRELHWHTPSEHTINGRRFDLEAHLVHESRRGNLTVIGILYSFGSPDPFLSRLYQPLKALASTRQKRIEIGVVNPNATGVGTSNYYRYKGSLTAPPCTENVNWIVFAQVKTVSKEQVRLLREAVNDGYESNARPTQPLNNRIVQYYPPRH